MAARFAAHYLSSILSQRAPVRRKGRIARLLLGLLVLAVIIGPTSFQGAAAGASPCPGPACSPNIGEPLDIPACGSIPGLAVPPQLPQPLTPLATPIVQASPVGTLPGHGQVTPTGEYRYRIPIEVPAGRAGMQPSIALAYSSRGKNGHLGVGFQVEGISTIERCPRTFATEGYSEGILFTDADVYCLDGHKLVAISGAYGGHGTEYRTEDDTFTRVTSYRDNKDLAWFQAWTDDGRVRIYKGPVVGDRSQTETPPRVFPVAEEHDRAGNTIRYAYRSFEGGIDVDHDGHREFVPDRIDYTSRTMLKAEAGLRSVRFVYGEHRPDDPYAVMGGHRIHTHLRLQSIELYAPTAATPTTPALAWRYVLGYTPSTATNRSLLTSVKRCGALGGCLAQKTFDWEQRKGPTYAAETFVGSATGETILSADLDGDGRDELVLLNQGAIRVRTTVDPAHPLAVEVHPHAFLNDIITSVARPVDLDSDGRAELLIPNASNNRSYVFSLVGSLASSLPLLSSFPLNGGPDDDVNRGIIFPVDIDGDGLQDIVEVENADITQINRWRWSYRINPGQGNPRVGAKVTAFEGMPPPLQTGSGRVTSFAGDLGAHHGTIFLSSTPDHGGVPTADPEYLGLSLYHEGPALATTPVRPGATQAYADMNGDGESDWVLLTKGIPAPGFNSLSIHDGAAWGGGFVTDPTTPGYGASMRVADLDGDGRDDLLVASAPPTDPPGGTQRLRLDAAGALEDLPFDAPMPDAIGDFNGDGLLDLAHYRSGPESGWTIYRQTGSGTVDRLRAVGDEHDPVPREEVVYAQDWSPDPEPGTCFYPQRCMRSGFAVVREHRVDQGSALEPGQARTARTLYSYEDARFDVRGRGFLGFGKVRRWEPARLSETITTYDHQTAIGSVYPFALRPKEVQQVTVIAQGAPRARYMRTNYVDALESLHQGKSYFVHPASFQSIEWEAHVAVDMSDAAKVHVTSTGAAPNAEVRVREGASVYDDYGNLTEQTVTTQGGVTSRVRFTYDIRENEWLIRLLASKEVTATEPDMGAPPARRTEYTYDDRGLLCHVLLGKDSTPGSQPDEVLTYAHDVEGLLRAVIASAPGEANRTSHITYDPSERVFPVQRWNDLGHTEASLYEPALGVVLAAEDANGVTTRAQIDDLGRPRLIAPEGAAATAIDYAAAGTGMQVTRTTAQTGAQAWTVYDELGRSAGEGHKGFDGTPIQQTRRFDTLGRAVRVSRPGFGAASSDGATYAFDNLDRLTRATPSPQGSITVEQGFFSTRTTDAEAHVRLLERDRDDRVIRSSALVNGAPVTTSYHHGRFGQVDRITDPLGNEVMLGYDQRGRRRLIDDPDAGTVTVAYNGFGEATHVVRGNALRRTFFDTLGRAVRIESGGAVTTFTWDTRPHGVGQLASATSPDGVTEERSYDAFGRLSGQRWDIDGESFGVGRAYDSAGRLSQISYPAVGGGDPFAVGYAYAPASGALAEVVDTATQQSFWKVTGRDEEDHLTSATFGNGIASARTYEPATGRLRTLSEGPALLLGYDYHQDGQVARRVDGLGDREERFDYDALERLSGWTIQHRIPGPPGLPGGIATLRATSYRYDDLGNLTKVFVGGALTEDNTYGTNGRPHALTGNGQGTYFYDDYGRQEAAPGRSTTYTDFDLPQTITTPVGITAFSYDASGARVKKSGPGGKTVTIAGLYERRERAGGVLEHVFYVHGSDGPVAQVVQDVGSSKRVRTYVHTDPLGSVGALTDADGAVMEQVQYYEPFGGRRALDGGPVSGALPEVPLGFTGHRHDDELGLIDMHGRVYDPAQRRFVTPDPHVTDPLDGQSFNRYSYVVNDPLNLTDPTGFDWWDGSLGCIGMECLGGPGYISGGFGLSFSFGSGGVNVNGASGGTSTPRFASGGPVLAAEFRTLSLPTGPSAPGVAAAGPRVQAWAEPGEESSWMQNEYVQGAMGFFVGAGLGSIPGGALTDEFLTMGGALGRGSQAARMGKALGEMLGGAWLTMGGIGGELIGTGLTTTGLGALIGVPAMAVSAGLVTGGVGNMAAGLHGFSDALMMEGGANAAQGRGATPKDSPFSFRRTHSIGGRASARNVDNLAKNMRIKGWEGPPIKVFEHNGTRYVLDGHHRLAAARQAGISEIPYELVPTSRLGDFGYQSVDELLSAASEAFGL